MQEINKNRRKGGMTKEERKLYMKEYKQFHKGRGIFSDVTDYLYVNIPFPVRVRKDDFEKVAPIDERNLEIEDEYCITFACGVKLSLQERLFGKKCISCQSNGLGIVKNAKFTYHGSQGSIFLNTAL